MSLDKIPVYLPGMSSLFPFGIYPLFPGAGLQPYAAQLAKCSLAPDGRFECRQAAIAGALDKDGSVWHRCVAHRGLGYFRRPAVAVVISWTPVPAWRRGKPGK